MNTENTRERNNAFTPQSLGSSSSAQLPERLSQLMKYRRRRQYSVMRSSDALTTPSSVGSEYRRRWPVLGWDSNLNCAQRAGTVDHHHQITAMAESSAIPPTLLSAIQETSMPDNIQTSGLHPFSPSSDKTIAFLYSLLDTTARVAHSVTLYSTTAVNDSGQFRYSWNSPPGSTCFTWYTFCI
ncbi:hypothetical protein EDB86DRAFT_1189796 [Lactarius hatsudake]|nr:hypothetical protein EDB86DRAFT_1189796 [Lactarius hatsudake]